MARSYLTCILLSLCVTIAGAQTAKLKLSIAHTDMDRFSYYISDAPFTTERFFKKYTVNPANTNRTAYLTFKSDHPQQVFIYFSPDEDTPGFNYHFYISPGDDLIFNVDLNKPDNGILVTGKGSNNNQPLLLKLTDVDVQPFYKDTLPNRVIAAINKQKPVNEKITATYIDRYKPSATFAKNLRYNLAYGDIDTYFSFKENNKFGIRPAYKRNLKAWQKVQDSMLTAVKVRLNQKQDHLLNNDDALASSAYRSLIRNFLLREKEHLWELSNEQPEQFYKEWYDTDKLSGEKLLQDDMQNLLKEKIINKYFTGQVAEYMYAILISEALHESNPQNLVVIFDRFKAKYPASKYLAVYNADIAAVVKKEQQIINGHMIFAPGNGLEINTFKEVLALTKGKTVLVDMWGTWCGPCREEITKNSAAVKAHFKDKGLDYLYVANYDTKNEKSWKKLIAYFNLEGTHILANEKLNKDIMATVKGSGYPTYFIIKKDGSFELSKAGYPMDRDKLIAQLEDALK